MDENILDAPERSFWEFKRYKEYEWFRLLVLFLLTIIGLYIVAHIWLGKLFEINYEYTRLDEQQKQHINRIYFDTDTSVNKATLPDAVVTDRNAAGTGLPSANRIVIKPVIPGGSNKCERVISYIQNQFNYKVEKTQLDDIRKNICSAPNKLEAISFLNGQRIKTESYFWLTGPAVYFEIIFWALFGVTCGLLFSLGVVGKNSTTDPANAQSVFDSSEIPSQFAKLLYAPLCTLIIVLGYNFFNDENIVDISSSKGVIVFAFIGGFYSSRLIAFLDRLKELVLPSSGISELPVNRQNPITLKNVEIRLQLDETTVPDELKNDITEIGLGDAVVTLQDEQGGDPISATRAGEDQSPDYTVPEIKPGRYIINATWSKEIDDQPVNLEAKQVADIRSSDIPVVVMLKKSDSEG